MAEALPAAAAALRVACSAAGLLRISMAFAAMGSCRILALRMAADLTKGATGPSAIAVASTAVETGFLAAASTAFADRLLARALLAASGCPFCDGCPKKGRLLGVSADLSGGGSPHNGVGSGPHGDGAGLSVGSSCPIGGGSLSSGGGSLSSSGGSLFISGSIYGM